RDGRVFTPAVIRRDFHVVHQVLERVHLVLLERGSHAGSGLVGGRSLERAADLNGVLPGLAVLGHADGNRGNAGLVDLGPVPAVANQPDRVVDGSGTGR